MNTKQNAEFELLDALERIVHYYDLSKTWSSLPSLTVQAKSEHENTMFGAARAAIKKFREQPVKQSQLADASLEPVAWMSPGKERLEFARKDTVYGSHTVPLYTRPQAREWIGLTDAEIGIVSADIWGSVLIAPQSYQAFAHAIEAKLKEKNDRVEGRDAALSRSVPLECNVRPEGWYFVRFENWDGGHDEWCPAWWDGMFWGSYRYSGIPEFRAIVGDKIVMPNAGVTGA